MTDANDDMPNSDSANSQADGEGQQLTPAEVDSQSRTPTSNAPSKFVGMTPELQGGGIDELPEDEPLTPELVEEEAIRGDFMLRWAAIFLAVLFGFSQIAETRTLVHIRSGDQMRGNGFLPGSADPFAYSLEGKSVANVSWLFDHVVSLAYLAGGEYGLTILKALVAGIIAYLLSLISIAGLPTWWSSICCVLAIGACSVDFLPITDLATLLGATLLLLMLHKYAEGSASGILWKLPVLVAVWGNLDTHAYVAVVIVGLFALGLTIKQSIAKKSGSAPGADSATLWKAAGLCVLALAINPSPLGSLLSVVTTYSAEYPTMAAMQPLSDTIALMDGRTEYFSVWNSGVLPGFEFAYLSGFSIVLIALVVLLIGRSRDDLPFALVLLGMTALAAWKLHELPVASLVAAAAAGTAAQRWYRRSFRQEYSIETMEVLFSRGGRAVTVFAMAFLGFCVVADRLTTRTPVGMGFEADMQTTALSLGAQLAELPDDARILPTRVTQGDYLIWHGRKTFVDSRAALYGQYSNEGSVIDTFDCLRKSLAASTIVSSTSAAADQSADSVANLEADDPEATEVLRKKSFNWKEGLSSLAISHLMVRLSPPGAPAYSMASNFLQSPNWKLSERGASAMFFEYTEVPIEQLDNSVRDAAFRADSNDKTPERFDFAREKDFYSKYLYASRPTLGAALREAQHFYFLDSRAPPELAFNVASAIAQDPTNKTYFALIGRILGGPILTIRRANEALLVDSQSANGYLLSGKAYLRLNEFENAIAQAFGAESIGSVRYMQAVMAFRQSTVLDPDSSEVWRELMQLYQNQGRTGLALECLNRYLVLEEDRMLDDPTLDEQLNVLFQMRTQWEDRRTLVQDEMAAFIEKGMPTDPDLHGQQKLQMIEQIYSAGHVRLALDLANDNIDLLRGQPQAELLRGRMLLEVGELEDGFAVLNQLAAVVRENQQRPEFSSLRWHESVAISQLSKGAYGAAIEIWEEQLAMVADVENKVPELSQPIVRTLPLVPNVESQVGAAIASWPMVSLQAARISLESVPMSRSTPTFLLAIAHIESGNLAQARFVLEGMLKNGGASPFRPLAEIYLSQLTNDAETIITESFYNVWEEYEFPDESAEKPAAEEQTTSPESPAPDASATEADKEKSTQEPASTPDNSDATETPADNKTQEAPPATEAPSNEPAPDADV